MLDREKRNCARLDMHAKTHLRLKDQSIEGEMDNVSLKGAFVEAVGQVGINDLVEFSIDDTPVNAKARVVRVTDLGMGLQFEKTLLE